MLREGSLCILKACALMVINVQRDDLRRRILQYKSSLAAISRLQDKLVHAVHEVESAPRSLLAEFERNITALEIHIQRSPTTPGQALGAKGAGHDSAR